MNKQCDNMASGASHQPPCTSMYTHTQYLQSHTHNSLSHTCTTHSAYNLTLSVSLIHIQFLCLSVSHIHIQTHTHTHTHTQFQYKTKKQNWAQLTLWYTTNKHMQNASHRKWQAQTHRKISPHPYCGNVRGPLQTTLQHYYLLSMNHANSV